MTDAQIPPIPKGNFTGCPSSLSGNTCPGSGGLDNIQNIMNYSDCPINFTTDQTNRMRTALATGGGSGRNNLWSGTNLTATDVNGSGICAPIADIISNNLSYTVCSGSSLIMKSASYNGTIASYAWAVSSGTAATPTASQTSIVFPTPGTSIVTLTVTNGTGSSSVSKTITVLDGSVQVPNNYFESFEAPGLPANWTVVNNNGGSVTWAQTNQAAIDGTSSYYIRGATNFANHIDYLVMPVINPQLNVNNTVFTFKYAYARASASNNDKFEVQGSIDCGGTWNTIIGLSAATMASGSGGVTSSPYTPAASEWKLYDVYAHPNWFTYTGYPSVMVRFMFQEDVGGVGFGNNFFLDDIIFSDPNGVNELTKSLSFRMAPNPTNGQTALMFNLHDASKVSVEVLDIMGRQVLPTENYNLNPGEQSIDVNKNKTLSHGIYFVNVSVNGAVMSRKLIID
ncbi:MAG: T9SS type A sorting domain-containing protein [Sphingobacteriaceae bacterium]|nr:T9SS type A sorting domain-containing protein [Sphingobacteriaceae bacterium]